MARVEWFGDAFLSKVQQAEKTALAGTAALITEDAKQRAPVATGTLRDSIAPTPVTTQGSGYNVKVEASAPYALYVEVGTVKMSAQPYLRPAFDGNVLEVFRLFREALA